MSNKNKYWKFLYEDLSSETPVKGNTAWDPTNNEFTMFVKARSAERAYNKFKSLFTNKDIAIIDCERATKKEIREAFKGVVAESEKHLILIDDILAL